MARVHTIQISFRIQGASEPDEYAVRAYDDDRLHDMALIGPDADGVFDAEFDRAADSARRVRTLAVRDLKAVFPEAEILRPPFISPS